MPGAAELTGRSTAQLVMTRPTREEPHQCSHRTFQQPIQHIEQFPLGWRQTGRCYPCLPTKTTRAHQDKPYQYANNEVIVHASASVPAESCCSADDPERRIDL